MDKLKVVKFIVFILTFLLVCGLLTALGSIYKKVSAPAAKLESSSLNQPSGSKIVSFQMHNDQAWILVKGGHKADRLIIINPAKPQEQPAEITLY